MQQPNKQPDNSKPGFIDPMDTHMPHWKAYQKAILTFLEQTNRDKYSFLSVNKRLSCTKGMLRTFSAAKQARFNTTESIGKSSSEEYKPLRIAAIDYLDRFTEWFEKGSNDEREAETLAKGFISMLEPFNKIVAAISFNMSPTKEMTVGYTSTLFANKYNQYCLSPYYNTNDYVTIVQTMNDIRNEQAHGISSSWSLVTSKNKLADTFVALMAVNTLTSQIHNVRSCCCVRLQSKVPGSYSINSEGTILAPIVFGESPRQTPLYPNPTNWFACYQRLFDSAKYHQKTYTVTFTDKDNNNYELGTFTFAKGQCAHFYFKGSNECLYHEDTSAKASLIEEGKNLLQTEESIAQTAPPKEIKESIEQDKAPEQVKPSTNFFNYKYGSTIDVESLPAISYKGGDFQGYLSGTGEDAIVCGEFNYQRNGLCYKGFAQLNAKVYRCQVFQNDQLIYEGTVDRDFHFVQGALTVPVQRTIHVYKGHFQGFHLKQGLLHKGGMFRYYGAFEPSDRGPYYHGAGIRYDTSYTHLGQFRGGKPIGFGIRCYQDGTTKQGLWQADQVRPTEAGEQPYIKLNLVVQSKCTLAGMDAYETLEGEKTLFVERGIGLTLRYQNEEFPEGELSFTLDTAPLPDQLTLQLP